MESKLPSFLINRATYATYRPNQGTIKTPFLEKGLKTLAELVKAAYFQALSAQGENYFQRVDPRIKVLFLLIFAIIISLKNDIAIQGGIAFFIFLLYLIGGIKLFPIYRRILFLAFLFGFLVTFPSSLNVIIPGRILLPLFHLKDPVDFYFYHIPATIGVTEEGLHLVGLITVKIINTLGTSFFVLSTTPFPDILKALKMLKVPDGFLLIVTLAYKYILIFFRTIEDLYLAKKSRIAKGVTNEEARKWVVNSMAFLFRKTNQKCEEIFKAMLARGYKEEISIPEIRKFSGRDWMVGLLFALSGLIFAFL